MRLDSNFWTESFSNLCLTTAASKQDTDCVVANFGVVTQILKIQ
jgi:hypothetical protein